MKNTMTLAELGSQYSESASAIKERLVLLNMLDKNGIMSETERFRLQNRINILNSIMRETRAMGAYLTHYYESAVR